MLKKISLYLLALTFMVAGTLHFLAPEGYRKIMPPYIPWHDFLIYLSGGLEILFGLLVLPPKTRKWGSMGLVLLLIAVFPANIYMAQTGGTTIGDAPYLPLIAWASTSSAHARTSKPHRSSSWTNNSVHHLFIIAFGTKAREIESKGVHTNGSSAKSTF